MSEDRIRRVLVTLSNANPSRRVAVAQWNKSLEGNLTDQFNDLRIAREALFFPDNPNQQLAFTRAARGAWLLGKDSVGRRGAWHALREAYAVASKAVHIGVVKETGEHRLVKPGTRVILSEPLIDEKAAIVNPQPRERS